MLKKIRDFIYDINDIFVAIVILLAAAGIIIWRSTAIMAYPEHLASKNQPVNTADVDFNGIDLTPENVENITRNIEIIEPGTGNNAPGEGQEQQPEGTAPDQGGTEDPSAQTGPNQGGSEDPNAQTDPNQGGTETPPEGTTPDQGGDQQTTPGTQDGRVTAEVFIDTWKNGERWPKIAEKLVQAGLISSNEKDAFVQAVKDLGLEQDLKPGTYTLTNTSFEDMIKVICRKK